MKTIAEQVREARGERTRREVAAAAGCTEQTLYRIESGQSSPDTQTLERIATALGIRVVLGELDDD